MLRSNDITVLTITFEELIPCCRLCYTQSVAITLRFLSRSGSGRRPAAAAAAGGLQRCSDYQVLEYFIWVRILKKQESKRRSCKGGLDGTGHVSPYWGYQGSGLTLRCYNCLIQVSLMVSIFFRTIPNPSHAEKLFPDTETSAMSLNYKDTNDSNSYENLTQNCALFFFLERMHLVF